MLHGPVAVGSLTFAKEVDEDEVDLRRHYSGSSRDYYRPQSAVESENDDEREKCAIA